MITRRRFACDVGAVAVLGGTCVGELFFANRSRPDDVPRQDVTWLDANENPAGPPPSALSAIMNSAAAVARYHFDELAPFNEGIATSEGLAPEQVLPGTGSAEVINMAIWAFTTSRPLITATPTYEFPIELAHTLGRKVIEVPLSESWHFPVGKLAEEATKAQGGLIYVCNPNNPTSSCTPHKDLRWLANNLPSNTILLVDEAYIHYVADSETESAIRFVQDKCNVVVTRTFSKIYGMAGARVGFGCAEEDLIRELKRFRSNVIPILGLRAATAAIGERLTLVPSRRANVARIRQQLCEWLLQRNVGYIEPHANFIMIDIGRDARSFGAEMFRRGVAVGRPFASLSQMLRVTIGSEQEMMRFRDVFWGVYSA